MTQSRRTKEIVSVSLGSSSRDHEATINLLNESFHIRRIGTDGDFKKAISLLESFDGNVDAIGLGGLDIYLYAGKKRFPLRDGVRFMETVKKTPVVDGSGLKNSLEKEVIDVVDREVIPLKEKKVLMVSALDRYGMAEAFASHGADATFGDFIFALGLDRPIRSLAELQVQAEKLLPELGKLPIGFLYPVGKKQEEIPPPDPKFTKYYDEAEIIAGDFHFIRKYMPENMSGKIVITNTVTSNDVELFKARGVSLLITTTPEFNGRSFGTNVLEAALLALLGLRWEEVKSEHYLTLLGQLGFKPRILALNGKEQMNARQ